MTDKPIVVEDVNATDVYVATLELKSVGTSKNIFPQLKWSHMFSKEPSTIPYAYQAALAIAQKIGAIVEEEPVEDVPDNLADEEEVVRKLDQVLKKARNEGDDTLH